MKLYTWTDEKGLVPGIRFQWEGDRIGFWIRGAGRKGRDGLMTVCPPFSFHFEKKTELLFGYVRFDYGGSHVIQGEDHEEEELSWDKGKILVFVQGEKFFPGEKVVIQGFGEKVVTIPEPCPSQSI